ncbi:adenylate/guanylate cyclase [Methylobacterium sp. 4-46]|uniref:adenylate/guanylate cyclase domain-containing protein n=1 Tax=unclassified Methylobacterium TaxID=2615210 RepID=UPI000152E3F2|nr:MULTISPECIES: adenylate/guanylate cyclase domain-containing protein [Methylobacterium]ACA17235.1 adenylate/guanylate cyclase [Methylobacterium sp. 4-46]WFT82917.1 adenylate/guanylate cyclase domain-containing protein [Methylobacterium nodulans]
MANERAPMLRPDDASHLNGRVARVLKSYLDQALSAPSAAIDGFVGMMIEDAGGDQYAEFMADLERIKVANMQLSLLIAEAGSSGVLLTADAENRALVLSRLKHDLRTPLNAIKGYSEMWIEDMSTLEGRPFVADLTHIRDCTDQMLARIEQLTQVGELRGESDAEVPMATSAAIAEFLRAVSPAAAEMDAPRLTGRILVVDDDPTNRDLLRRRLAREGHDVSLADDGATALAKVAAEDYDLILLDMIMPGMSGFEVLCRLKASETSRHVPVIVISGIDDIGSIVRCLEAGAEDYLPKTFNPTILRVRITTSIERKFLREREERLLLNVLPRPILARMRNGEAAIADRFAQVTVLFCDLVGFTPLAGRLTPGGTVDLLSRVFSAFDRSVARRGVEKIKTIGDAYMAAGGIPETTPDHARRIALLAFDMMADVEEVGRALGVELAVRVGIHSGEAVAGVIGQSRFAYDVWGDSVNIAARMESHGQAGRIHISESTRRALGGDFFCTPRGVTHIKGKGPMETYFLDGASHAGNT